MLRIGTVRLASRFLLCPLAGFTDLTFRQVVRPQGGLGLAYTELVNPQGLKRQTPRSLEIVATAPDDEPLAVQLYGTSVEDLAEAAQWAAERGSPLVDINMGCPVPKVAGKGGGSGILRHCPDAVALAAAVVRACPRPVTVKTRLGWEVGNLVAPDLVRRLADVGVAAVTIHGRYGEQKFGGSADWDAIARVVDAHPGIPVIGNGDLRSAEQAVVRMAAAGCAGVMIGRRALSDPWIFRDADALDRTGRLPAPPTRLERLDLVCDHFERLRERHGERRAAVEFRKRMSWYAKTVGPCPTLRRGVPLASSAAEFHALVDEFRARLAAGLDGGLAAPPEIEAAGELSLAG